LLTCGFYFFKNKNENEVSFTGLAIVLIIMATVGVVNAFFQGQPIPLGLGASRTYFIILFYLVFMSKRIETQKLFNLIIFAGIFICLVSNISYLLHGKINLFSVPIEEVRAGQLRLLPASFFIVFSSLIVFGEYIRKKNRLYLALFIYMSATVVIQEQSRAALGGIIFTAIILLVLAKKINFVKAIILGGPAFALLIILLPIFQSTFFGKLYDLTRYEITSTGGGVGHRIDTFNYYYGEIRKSPIIGRGIWNMGFRGYNPENMQDRFMYLSDIGISSLMFHFGLLGLIWLIILLKKVYKTSFLKWGKLKENIHLGVIGYFIFSISVMITKNRISDRRAIVYLALVLALLSQANYSNQDDEDINVD
jgi:hypothetical protein